MIRHYWAPSALFLLLVMLIYLYQRTRFGSEVSPAISMPDKISVEVERALYLSPGGRYTATDIRANGYAVASDKYRGFQARHDFSPQSGDRLCPITRTKANPECSWIIDGRRYEFCCPPCIDEFLRLAKEPSARLLEPDAYLKP